MAKSNYQSARKEWGEMYEHELVECAAELDGMIDELIASDNKAIAERDRLAATLDNLREVVPEGNKIYTWSEIRTLQAIVAARKILYPASTETTNEHV